MSKDEGTSKALKKSSFPDMSKSPSGGQKVDFSRLSLNSSRSPDEAPEEAPEEAPYVPDVPNEGPGTSGGPPDMPWEAPFLRAVHFDVLGAGVGAGLAPDLDRAPRIPMHVAALVLEADRAR